MPIFPTGTDSLGVSAHGTIIKRNGTAIGEVKDITPPALSHKTIETTTHNGSTDSYVPGIMRRSDMTFMVNFLPSGNVSHGTASGLEEAWATASKDGYEIDFTDGSIWMFSGYVTGIAPKAPVDGGFEAQITIRPTGGMAFLP